MFQLWKDALMGFSRSPLLVKHAWKQTSCWEKIFYLTLSVRLYFGFCSLVHGVVPTYIDSSPTFMRQFFLSVCVSERNCEVNCWINCWWNRFEIVFENKKWASRRGCLGIQNCWASRKHATNNYQFNKLINLYKFIWYQNRNKMQHCVDKFVLILVSKSGKVPFSLQDWFPKVTL